MTAKELADYIEKFAAGHKVSYDDSPGLPFTWPPEGPTVDGTILLGPPALS